MAVYNGQSWMFWTSRDKSTLNGNNSENDRPNLDARISEVSQLSRLTSELSSPGREEEDGLSRGDRSEVHCKNCGGAEFKVRFVSGEKVLACVTCGELVD